MAIIFWNLVSCVRPTKWNVEENNSDTERGHLFNYVQIRLTNTFPEGLSSTRCHHSRSRWLYGPNISAECLAAVAFCRGCWMLRTVSLTYVLPRLGLTSQAPPFYPSTFANCSITVNTAILFALPYVTAHNLVLSMASSLPCDWTLEGGSDVLTASILRGKIENPFCLFAVLDVLRGCRQYPSRFFVLQHGQSVGLPKDSGGRDARGEEHLLNDMTGWRMLLQPSGRLLLTLALCPGALSVSLQP
jgi:hypothetical protein